MSHDTTPTKVCSKCGQEFPATPEYFSRSHKAKDGLNTQCKVCIHAYQQENRDKKQEYDRVYQQVNQDVIRKKAREYYQVNRDKRLEYDRVRRQSNPEKKRKYRQANKEKIREHKREYRQAHPEKHRIRNSRREARKRNLPDTFTVEQWQACLEYHHYCCAVCGYQLRDLFGNIEPHADHWIPLANPDCPGTTADNMVCLCSVCNLSKHHKMPDAWLSEKFGKRKAVQISERIHAYFAWTQSPDSS